MLIYRQYFEHTSVQTAFVGYGEEAVALTIRRATDEIGMDEAERVSVYPSILPLLHATLNADL